MTNWAIARGFRVEFPQHPLDFFLHDKAQPRATEASCKIIPFRTLMPWIPNRVILNFSSLPSPANAVASRLQNLHWVAFVSGSFPKEFGVFFALKDKDKDKDRLAQFSQSIVFAAFDVWTSRSRLVRKSRVLAGCPSPYHYLKPLFDNPWACECSHPPQKLPSHPADRRPLSVCVGSHFDPRVAEETKSCILNVAKKRKPLKSRKRKAKVMIPTSQLRRSERLRNRKR